jgi:hypothetical protein
VSGLLVSEMAGGPSVRKSASMVGRIGRPPLTPAQRLVAEARAREQKRAYRERLSAEERAEQRRRSLLNKRERYACDAEFRQRLRDDNNRYRQMARERACEDRMRRLMDGQRTMADYGAPADASQPPGAWPRPSSV